MTPSYDTLQWQALDENARKDVLQRPVLASSEILSAQVASIVEKVQEEGDQALFALTEKFDGVALKQLAITEQQVEQAKARLSAKRLQSLQQAYDQIFAFHNAQQFSDITVETSPGVVCTLKSEAIESVGLYIPAGSAPLPSTVLMLGVPAKIAQCDRVVLVCPPDKNGNIADEIIVAANLCNVNEIYTVGGAQAIAALALGTNTIKAVNKVFGPGNKYVTEAKKQLSQQIPGFAIDMPAGPSEVLVIADDKANPEFVAADLLSQAEHGPDSQVILVSESQRLIEQTQAAISKQLTRLSRKDIAAQALTHARYIKTQSLQESVEVSNSYGPEHLIVQTESPQQLIGQLRNAGSIFLGAYSPESAGDYASGTNHVLPTYGYSKVYSSLSLADFSRRYTVQTLSKQGLANIAPCILELTDAEGLDAHGNAVSIRLETNNEQ
ncbi:histidinol dehydrogenase [Thalassotalea agarivorans]|nr:histidinol dehydrogenase [Thalassotalea agarivorans]